MKKDRRPGTRQRRRWFARSGPLVRGAFEHSMAPLAIVIAIVVV
jgi:hypothetical protein